MKRRIIVAVIALLSILTIGAVRSKIAASHAGEWVKVRSDDLILGVDPHSFGQFGVKLRDALGRPQQPLAISILTDAL